MPLGVDSYLENIKNYQILAKLKKGYHSKDNQGKVAHENNQPDLSAKDQSPKQRLGTSSLWSNLCGGGTLRKQCLGLDSGQSEHETKPRYVTNIIRALCAMLAFFVSSLEG